VCRLLDSTMVEDKIEQTVTVTGPAIGLTIALFWRGVFNLWAL